MNLTNIAIKYEFYLINFQFWIVKLLKYYSIIIAEMSCVKKISRYFIKLIRRKKNIRIDIVKKLYHIFNYKNFN